MYTAFELPLHISRCCESYLLS